MSSRPSTRSRLTGIVAAAVIVGALGGCSDDNEVPSKEDFVAQMRKVLEVPPPDNEIDCLYAAIAQDPPFAQDLMTTDPSADSRSRMRVIAAACVLDPNGRGVPPTTSTTSQPRS